MLNKSIEGRVAVVLGASGAIGRTIVKRLYDEGMQVALAARNTERLKATVEELGLVDRYFIMTCDGSNVQDVEHLIRKVKSRFGAIDLVVISSGGYEPLDLSKGLEDANKVFMDMVSKNLVAVFNVAYASALVMKKQGSGCIVNISSHAAFRVLSGGIAYGPSKSGAFKVMSQLALDLKPYGVRVIDIQPSTVNTPEMRRFIPDDKLDLAVQPEEIAERIAELFKVDAVNEVDHPMIGELSDF